MNVIGQAFLINDRIRTDMANWFVGHAPLHRKRRGRWRSKEDDKGTDMKLHTDRCLYAIVQLMRLQADSELLLKTLGCTCTAGNW
jgi:hypothetical protein